MNPLLSCFLMLIASYASSQKEIESKISEVTVFTRNAQITRVVNFIPQIGDQELVLTGLSTSINPSSVQVQTSNPACGLMSVKYENNYLKTQSEHPKVKEVKAKKENAQDELNLINDKITTYKGMLEIYDANKNMSESDRGFTPTELTALSMAYEKNYPGILAKKRKLEKEKKELTEKINQLNKQLRELNNIYKKPSGNIVMKVTSSTQKPVTFYIKYVVRNASWSPIYDIRAQAINKPLTIKHKASIRQNTGVDWHNVALTISTGNPSENQNVPSFSPMYVNFVTNRYDNISSRGSSNKSYEKKVLYMDANADADDDEVMYEAEPMPANSNAFSYGATVDHQQTATEFDIEKKQSILSDRKEHFIALTKETLSAEYVYQAFPRVCKSAYLTAKITEWGNLNLSSGNANIFFEEQFVGTSYINTQSTEDTLTLSLGKDKGINIQRKPIKDLTSTKVIGQNKTEKIGYELMIKNNKPSEVSLEVNDQIPVTKNNQIEVEMLENSKAQYTSESGKLSWNISLKPGKSTSKTFSYQVKYPKKQRVSGSK